MKIHHSLSTILLMMACSVAAFQPSPGRRRVLKPQESCNWIRYVPQNHCRDQSALTRLLLTATTSEPPAAFPSSPETQLPSFLNADRQTTFEMPEIHNRTLTKTEREFRDLLGDFAHYSERDILSVPSPRMRTLFEGVKASAGEEAVYRSFEVLFTDFLPIRVAGRLIYNRLKSTMEESQALRQQQVETVASETGLDLEEVDMLRIAFLSIAQENHYKDGQVFLSKQQLEESGIGDIVIQDIGYASVDAFFDVLDANSDGRLSFEELMMGLYSYAVESCYDDPECNPSQVLHELLMPLLNDDRPKHHRQLDAQHQKFSDRYDEMIDTFSEWESALVDTSGEGRQLDVLRGCFVGAKNEAVLEALRIVYVDYRPLRMAGNLIFKLMSALVNSRQN